MLHAFFVAAEFAVVAVDRNRIENLAAEGHRGAVSVLRALKTLSFQLSGAQLGITLTSLLVGFIAEPAIGEPLAPLIADLPFVPADSSLAVSVGVALALATATEMVVAELIPKNLAIARPLSVAFAVTTPFRLINAAFRPVIVFLNASANAAVRMLGIEPRDELISTHSLEELEVLIHSSRAEGALREEDFSLLARSITFGEKTAADALVPRTSVVALSVDQSLTGMALGAMKSGHSRFPVFDGDLDHVVGIVHVKDSFAIPVDQRDRVTVGEIMQEAFVVPETRNLDTLLLEMRRERRQMAMVVDEYGGTAGIITLEDILEEIVGDIEDEYDPSGPEVQLTTPFEGAHVVPGLLHPDEVKDTVGFEMPEGDYDTLAGFLLTLFDRIPEKGDHISYEGWEFKVVEMDNKRIAQILTVAPSGSEESGRQ